MKIIDYKYGDKPFLEYHEIIIDLMDEELEMNKKDFDDCLSKYIELFMYEVEEGGKIYEDDPYLRTDLINKKTGMRGYRSYTIGKLKPDSIYALSTFFKFRYKELEPNPDTFLYKFDFDDVLEIPGEYNRVDGQIVDVGIDIYEKRTYIKDKAKKKLYLLYKGE